MGQQTDSHYTVNMEIYVGEQMLEFGSLRGNAREAFIRVLYDLYRQAPGAADYMERIARAEQMIRICMDAPAVRPEAEREMSMGEFYEDFREYMDPILECCRYQKLSEKNIFDMYLIFNYYIDEITDSF